MPYISLYIVYFIACPWLAWRSIEAVTTLTWPTGKYGLPKANVGCPLSTNSEWLTGWRYEDTEDENTRNIKSPSFHLDATVGADINRTFCIKTNDLKKLSVEWPPGQYCIYKKGNCPKGLKEGSIHWDDEDYKNINDKGGTLPDGVYDRNTKIYYCCRTDGDKSTPMPLPLISPFYLKAYNSSECQRVQGAISTEEYIRYDTEDESNRDIENGSYPYGGGINNHNISYCYYKSCLYTYSLDNNETVTEFISPKFFGEGFPYSQKCKWRFVVPQNKKLQINFLETYLEGDDTIDIHHGWDSGSSLGTIKSTTRPVLAGYSSQSNVITVVFESKAQSPSRKRSRGFRGTFRAIGSKEVVRPAWPKGTYGLPRPSLGCPLSNAPEWKTGWRFQDTEDDSPNNENSDSFHMDTVVKKSAINKTFCIATKSQKTGQASWPKGQYCIYKKGNCPKGFSEGYIFFDDENHKNLNEKGGELPDGEYNKDTNISYCCRTDGDKLTPITLPVMSPFYLMAYNTSECQRVKGALATEEFIRYDNQDTDNKDSMNGTHPYEEGKKNITIMYCYYEACHFTIGEKSQEFMSPNYLTDGYPNSQFCSWRILVKTKTEQILIKFPEFDLQKGNDGDKVMIYSGWNDTAPLLAAFNGDNPPPDEGVAFESSVVYVVFTSDSQGRSKGFRGLFLNQNHSNKFVPTKPITLPVERAQPTTGSTKKAPTNNTAPTAPSAGKKTGAKSVPIGVIIPVVLAVVIVGAMVSVYCIKRKRMETRVRKTLSQSKLVTVSNDSYTYRDLDTQDDGSIEELQDIFPSS